MKTTFFYEGLPEKNNDVVKTLFCVVAIIFRA
jgi:hypothetical protein